MNKKVWFGLAVLAYCAIGYFVAYDPEAVQVFAAGGCLVGAMAGKVSRS